MKSPAINAGLGPLRRLEAIASQEHAKALEGYEIAAEKFEARKAAAKSVLRGNAKKAMQGGGAAGDEGFPDIGQKPLPPRPTRFITNDATYEAAGAIMGDNPNGILVLRDELVGFLAPLDRQENAAARGFWLESYNGLGGYTFDRIGRGTVRLDAVCAGFVGGVQPARLAAYVKDATSGGAGDDGLLQRFSMTVWPDADPNWEDVDRYPDTAAKRTAAAVFERLVKIEPKAIGASKGEFDELPSLSFDPEAQEAFGEWREKLERDVRREGLHPAIESHFTKYRKLVPALALITHLADAPDGGPVSVDAMVSAMAWDEYLRPQYHALYYRINYNATYELNL
jgi:putative DNA primase/helicase